MNWSDDKGVPWQEYVDTTVKEVARLRNEALDLVLQEPFDWKAHSTALRVGIKVAYAKKFLKAIGCNATDPMWSARGIVTSFKVLSKDVILATIQWEPQVHQTWHNPSKNNQRLLPRSVEECEWPSKVNVKNLAPVGPNLAFCGD